MIRLQNVTRTYGDAGSTVVALAGISLEIPEHQFAAVTGPSGCGKSTLMHLLGGLDTPSSGEIYVQDLPLHNADDQALTAYRRHKLGIVFQFFNLLPTMSVLENAAMPLLLQGGDPSESEAAAIEMLKLVGMDHRTRHFPNQLSGGEMQRTAIARALVHKPCLLLADEPTGNLDSGNSEQVMRVFHDVAERSLTTMILVTHSEEVAGAAQRRIRMRDGRVED